MADAQICKAHLVLSERQRGKKDKASRFEKV